MTFHLTTKQDLAMDVLCGPARHILLFGGSRSGKTFLIVRAIVVRALAEAKSRHLIARFRFNAVKTSIVFDTLPAVMSTCWPDLVDKCKLDKSDWRYILPNGSEIWFGGLDDKERTEKILGNEYASIYANECSQITWAARVILVTRLAQKTNLLRLKAYYDCNPPSVGHWTNKLFIQGRSPDTREEIQNKEDYAAFGPMNPHDNAENIAPEYLAEMDNLPLRQRKRFRDGLFSDDSDNALWTIEIIEQCRFGGDDLPDMQRVVIGVDPSGCAGEEDKRSDEIGIVVCGLGTDGRGYVLEDLSGRYGPEGWGRIVAEAFDRHEADAVVAETNFGGDMVAAVIRSSRPGTPVRQVKATRGKVVRAEPISALFEQGKVYMDGSFPILEDQLCGMTTAGFIGEKSPDRADAMIWALTHMFPGITRRQSEFRRAPRVVLGYDKSKRYGAR